MMDASHETFDKTANSELICKEKMSVEEKRKGNNDDYVHKTGSCDQKDARPISLGRR